MKNIKPIYLLTKLSNFSIIILAIMISSTCISSQSYHRFSFSISLGHHITENLDYGTNRYAFFDESPNIEINSHSTLRTNSYNFGIGIRVIKKTTIKASIGSMNYGLNYRATVTPPFFSPSTEPFMVIENQKFSYLEVGLSINHVIKMTKGVDFFIEPGFLWYTNDDSDSRKQFLLFQKSNNYSAMLYTGVELPLAGDNLFISVGAQLKMPLQNFAEIYLYENMYSPFSIGILGQFTYKF